MTLRSDSRGPGFRGPRRISRRTIAGSALVCVLLVPAAASWWVMDLLGGSLPRTEGELSVRGLGTAVTIERDTFGIPRIRGASRADVAFATGFVHAQDRFFQMDLLRRRAAGELAALLGEAGLDADRTLRPFRLRDRARRALGELPPREAELVASYSAGVNAGLADLARSPWEYLVLRTEPVPWQEEDTLLAVLAMFTHLQDWRGVHEEGVGLLHDRLPWELFEFLVPRATRFDVPVAGAPAAPREVPGPEVLDLRQEGARRVAVRGAPPAAAGDRRPRAEELGGSNAWALSGEHTAHGGAILANDLHMTLAVPNVWYRAELSWDPGDGRHRSVTGLTLPGTPAVVVGSNGQIAWGFTNSLADSVDLVWVEAAGGAEDAYRAPGGPLPFERHTEVLDVRGGSPEPLEVVDTIWGTVVGEDHAGRPVALRWVPQEPGAVDLGIVGLETAETLEEALAVGHRAGLPAQNLLLAGADGRIAWTVAGYLPQRVGFDGLVPGSWADGSRGWAGRLPAEEYPRVVDPESGRLWSANNRMLGGEAATVIGVEGYQLGARARQIRDRLVELDEAGTEEMLALQLDHRALLWEPWRELLLEVLGPEVARREPLYDELRRHVEAWDGLAAPESVGFRLVRSFRINVANATFAPLTTFDGVPEPEVGYRGAILEHEEPLRSLIEARPAHLLGPGYASWDELFVQAVDDTLRNIGAREGGLASKTWGSINGTAILHPLSGALPFVGRWLDMPRQELPGARHVPRVQEPSGGATVRFAVSPGREQEGYLHTPGGQSGHPRSPHYRDAHAAWAVGEPTPFVVGPAEATLRLVPVP